MAVMPAVIKGPSVRDIMITSFVVLKPDMDIDEAIRTIVDKGLMGAPVVDAGKLVGILSEKDCLRILASALYDAYGTYGGLVRDHMTTELCTVDVDMDFATITSLFLSKFFRGLPVVDGDRLVGLVSRRDVLIAIQRAQRWQYQAQYPDYRRPQ